MSAVYLSIGMWRHDNGIKIVGHEAHVFLMA